MESGFGDSAGGRVHLLRLRALRVTLRGDGRGQPGGWFTAPSPRGARRPAGLRPEHVLPAARAPPAPRPSSAGGGEGRGGERGAWSWAAAGMQDGRRRRCGMRGARWLRPAQQPPGLRTEDDRAAAQEAAETVSQEGRASPRARAGVRGKF